MYMIVLKMLCYIIMYEYDIKVSLSIDLLIWKWRDSKIFTILLQVCDFYVLLIIFPEIVLLCQGWVLLLGSLGKWYCEIF